MLLVLIEKLHPGINPLSVDLFKAPSHRHMQYSSTVAPSSTTAAIAGVIHPVLSVRYLVLHSTLCQNGNLRIQKDRWEYEGGICKELGETMQVFPSQSEGLTRILSAAS